MSQYPEHDKLTEHQQSYREICHFLEWFLDRHLLCRPIKGGERYQLEHVDIGKEAAVYFGLDPRKLETERRAMLNELRHEIFIKKNHE